MRIRGLREASFSSDGFGFPPADVPAPVEDLAVQVALLDDVAVDDPQGPTPAAAR